MDKISHADIVARQEQRRKASRLPLVVVLNNIRSLYNVGSIFRTSDGVGIEHLWLCGITGHPPNNQISKTALGAEESVPWTSAPDVLTVVKGLKARGYHIVLLEQIHESVLYDDFVPAGPVALVIGNEIEGITPTLLPYCDTAVEIPMAGLKNSLNVSVAFGVIAYHLRASWQR